MTATQIEAAAAPRPLAAVGQVAATSHTRAAGKSARARERAEQRAIRKFVRRHRRTTC